eukprot:GHVU01161584.1.p1 GENE.GHVU01161584.1~~GHVU01161584.1.p1  ORF type:complete len:265 (-),score=20.63 GHVU01161584.1:1049-1843(-)
MSQRSIDEFVGGLSTSNSDVRKARKTTTSNVIVLDDDDEDQFEELGGRYTQAPPASSSSSTSACLNQATPSDDNNQPRPRKRKLKRYAPWKAVIADENHCPSHRNAVPTSLPPTVEMTVLGTKKKRLSVAIKPTPELLPKCVAGLREFLTGFNDFSVCAIRCAGPVLHSIQKPDWRIDDGSDSTYVGKLYQAVGWFPKFLENNGFELRHEQGVHPITKENYCGPVTVIRDTLTGETDEAYRKFVSGMVRVIRPLTITNIFSLKL